MYYCGTSRKEPKFKYPRTLERATETNRRSTDSLRQIFHVAWQNALTTKYRAFYVQLSSFKRFGYLVKTKISI